MNIKRNDILEIATPQVTMGSFTAKDILKQVFACTQSLSDDDILRQVGTLLASGGTGFASFTASAWLISSTASDFLKLFWSDLQSLNEGDREAVQVSILLGLKQSAKVGRGGRPKGAKGQDTGHQIRLAA